jgi:hypothetical protein
MKGRIIVINKSIRCEVISTIYGTPDNNSDKVLLSYILSIML